jgi:capsular exopolysaccharide synthesis family protein
MTPPSDLNNMNGPSHMPEESRAVIQPRPLPLPPLAVPPTPPALSAAPNALLLLQALRRRLALALTVGLLFAAVAGAATWFLMPAPKFTARTQLYVSATPPNILFPDDSRVNHENFVKSQAYLIKDRFILNQALNLPGVAELSIVQEQTDKLQWLETEIKVELHTTEFIHISLSGDRPEELQKLVSAVTQSYLENVVDKERNLSKKRLDGLMKILTSYEGRSKTARERLRAVQEQNGALNEKSMAILQELALDDLRGVKADLTRVRREIRELHNELGLRPEWMQMVWPQYAATFNCLPGLELPVNHAVVALLHDDNLIALATLGTHASIASRELDELINKDEFVVARLKQIQALEASLEHMRQSALNDKIFERTSADLRKQLDALTKEVEARRQKLRPVLFEQYREQLKHQALGKRRQVWDRYTTLKELEKRLVFDATRLGEQTKEIRKQAADLSEYKDEIDKNEKVILRASEKLESMRVEQEAPSRVTLLNKDDKDDKPLAMLFTPNETKRKWMATGGAAGGALALILLAFSWFEFQSRKIVSPQEVVEGLGLRLIGTVPDFMRRGLSAWLRRGDGDSVYSESLLAESVDSARTMLLHAARQEKLQIVMITSAVAGEGKTSLASHLAASLARTGRRTLLMDSDLRNPTLHRLFDRSRAPGLSELLRGDVDMVGAVRDTPIPKLWLISAGHADLVALQTLALDALPQILQQLRRQFDFIVVDSCPVLPVADALLVGQHVDAVIFSLLREVSRMPRVYAAYQRLAVLGVRMLGAVVNGTHDDEYRADYRYVAPEQEG